ncbi:NYN domain-containing protein [Candidatus Saccharibacteria bacterium]|nr:NYN domain-containing protein [Candidatus Saccharibacteria bacterium]
MSTIVFVDGENFQKKIRQVFAESGLKWDDKKYGQIRLKQLLKSALPDERLSAIHYYVAKLHVYPETKEKSEELVQLQRTLKSNLSSQGVRFIVSGNVRMYPLEKGELLFKEKGVDVRLAVDAISLAADKKIKTAVLCSSDSDMQPVVKELKRRKVRVIYLGFQTQPNRGLMYTCDETVLIRKNELKKYIIDTYQLKIRRFDDIKPPVSKRKTSSKR